MNRKCRFCNENLELTFVDLGMSPLSNSFLKKSALTKKEPIFPLHAYVCKNCFLVQLEEFSKPQEIFNNYLYFSSISEIWLNHAKEFVNLMIKKFNLDQKSFVIEIASNDGYLLQNFLIKKIPCLGIEPATNVAEIAIKKGIRTMNKFFGEKTAIEIIQSEKKADLIIGNNVLAHVPEINDFVKSLKIILKDNGVITMEFPHLMKLIEKNQFDTIYHEHFSYISFYTVLKIFQKHYLKIFDVEEIDTHGGSLRIYATHKENMKLSISSNVEKLLDKEILFGITKISTYINFEIEVKKIKKQLQEFIELAMKENKKIICYGAAAKGNTLLNYCEINSKNIECVVDLSHHKQGMYLPGTHLPIKHPNEIQIIKPDYVLILPWNLKNEIIKQISFIRTWGGKFVIPIPEVKIF